MPQTYSQVTALPVVVPLAVACVVVLLWSLHRRDGLTLPRVLVSAVLCGYGAGVVANTLFPVTLGRGADSPPWTAFLNLVPLANTEALDMLQNVLVFVPLGVLLPLFGVRSAGRVLLAGFLMSLGMELVQLLNAVVARGGHIADVNDLLANTLGAPIGYVLVRAALLVPVLARWAAAATWPATAAAEPADLRPVAMSSPGRARPQLQPPPHSSPSTTSTHARSRPG